MPSRGIGEENFRIRTARRWNCWLVIRCLPRRSRSALTRHSSAATLPQLQLALIAAKMHLCSIPVALPRYRMSCEQGHQMGSHQQYNDDGGHLDQVVIDHPDLQ